MTVIFDKRQVEDCVLLLALGYSDDLSKQNKC